jgi:hypothetical protein
MQHVLFGRNSKLIILRHNSQCTARVKLQIPLRENEPSKAKYQVTVSHLPKVYQVKPSVEATYID